MLTLYRRGRLWWARGSVHGRRLRTSLDTQFKEVAWQRCITLELNAGRKATRWDDFQKQFLGWKDLHIKPATRTKYKFVVQRFGAHLLSRKIALLHDCTPELLAEYSRARQFDVHPHTKRTLGPEGLKSDLRVLRVVFNYAIECGYLDRNPVIAPKLNTVAGRTMPFSRDEIRRLLESPYVQDEAERWALVLTFLYTGLRISDVSALTKKAVDLKAHTILLRTSKRDKDVFLALHPDLRAALVSHLASLNPPQRFSAFLFPTRTGRKCWPQSLDAKLRRIFRHCGIEKGHAHRFRDTFAVALLEQGASLYDVSKLLGTTARVAELHYAPYVQELRNRATVLVGKLSFQPAKTQLGHSG